MLSYETSLFERRVLVGLKNYIILSSFPFFNLELEEENGVSYDWKDKGDISEMKPILGSRMIA